MTDSTLTAPPLAAAAAPAGPANVEELVRYVPGFLRGARWFWWIAGLSAVNVACDLGHAGINFVLGLAFTQLAHVAFASNIAIALVIDALFIGGFYLVEADDLDRATEIAARIPAARIGGSVEIRPVVAQAAR